MGMAVVMGGSGGWQGLVGGVVGSLAWALEKVRWGGGDGGSRMLVVVVGVVVVVVVVMVVVVVVVL